MYTASDPPLAFDLFAGGLACYHRLRLEGPMNAAAMRSALQPFRWAIPKKIRL